MKDRNDILVIVNRDPLFGMTEEEVTIRLRNALANRVSKAFFFGSFGTAAFDRHSDIDIILVKDTDIPFMKRAAEFDDLKELLPSLDILVYTPSEFESLTADPSPGFWRSVVRSMRRFV